MLLIYNLIIRIYLNLIFIYSFFNKKAKLWINGRKNVKFLNVKKSIWFHFASLGEFEQGRPVLEAYRAQYPSSVIVITFFSPSGYEIRKNTPLANYVYYLPIDTKKNAMQFIETINPGIAIFTKYEYWYHYFNELHSRSIPVYIISGIFRPKQVFFKWYGSLHRKILSFVAHFFVQDNESERLLKNLGINNVSVSGDTRFDRVWQNSSFPKQLNPVEQFKAGQRVFIGGSTWPEDEELIAQLIPLFPDWKFILAPHEIEEAKIARLLKLLPGDAVIRYSEIERSKKELSQFNVLIIDNIGMLSSLYQYGDIAFIGGGFGAGIHNTLEAAAFGLPVIFGPEYERFKEARDLVDLQLGFCVENDIQLKAIAEKLIHDNDLRAEKSASIKAYVKEHTGATASIMQAIS
ncbi:3-deoxy-D-manno-octulosonic acid transferase [Mucilaginibacter sp. HMF5004]|uniref:3-deoxy-D-manno-octulosonic acid transferase n=1 Tax=Mucilaginibacter rivuli TaxID=2857527 RepID=UPI001C5DBC36|nr:glycosyltransferase N-terminal domain-containing protein [Mucilaginibacter rivuli]MBW4890916.1 3-deoxy-D-manno-octulosonic acid transferase [Mucilaginibacter rivuli]